MRFVRLADLSVFGALQHLALSGTAALAAAMAATNSQERRLKANTGLSLGRRFIAGIDDRHETPPMFITQLHIQLPRSILVGTASRGSSDDGGDNEGEQDHSGRLAIAVPIARTHQVDPLAALTHGALQLAHLREVASVADDSVTTNETQYMSFIPAADTFRSRLEAAVGEALRVVAGGMVTRIAATDDFRRLREAVLSKGDETGIPRGAAVTAATMLASGAADAEAEDDVEESDDRGDAGIDDDVADADDRAEADAIAAGGGARTETVRAARRAQIITAAEHRSRAAARAQGSVSAAAGRVSGSAAAATAKKRTSPRAAGVLASLRAEDGDAASGPAGSANANFAALVQSLVPASAPAAGRSVGSLSAAITTLQEDANLRTSLTDMKISLESAFSAAARYAATFAKYRIIAVACAEFMEALSPSAVGASQVVDLHAALDELSRFGNVCDGMPTVADISQLLRVDSTRARRLIQPAPAAASAALAAVLPEVAYTKGADLLVDLLNANSRLRAEPENVDEYVVLMRALAEVQVCMQ
jgi:hypothetical protein